MPQSRAQVKPIVAVADNLRVRAVYGACEQRGARERRRVSLRVGENTALHGHGSSTSVDGAASAMAAVWALNDRGDVRT